MIKSIHQELAEKRNIKDKRIIKQDRENRDLLESDRYEVIQKEPIGRGTWGVVYKVRDLITGETLAAKIFDPTEIAKEQIKGRKLNRNKLGQKEVGPFTPSMRVVPRKLEIDNFGQEFIIMPLYNRPLSERLGDDFGNSSKNQKELRYYVGNNITLEEALGYAKDIASGLDELHTIQKRVHGDLKSDNILLDEQDTANISDLGTATAASFGQSSSPRSNMGFLYTRAPECFKDSSHPQRQSDVYSWASLVTRIFSPKYLLENEIERITASFTSIENEEEREKQIRNAITDLFNDTKKVKKMIHKQVKHTNMPRALKKLVERCAEPDILNRPENGKLLSKELESALDRYRAGKLVANGLRRFTLPVAIGMVITTALIGNGLRYERPDISQPPQLQGPLYLSGKPGEEPIAFDTEKVQNLPKIPTGWIPDNKGIDRNAARVTKDRTTAFLTAQYARTFISGLGSGEFYNENQFQTYLAYTDPVEKSAFPSMYLKEYTIIAKNIEVALGKARSTNNLIDLEDTLVIARLGENTLRQVQKASNSFDFQQYLEAKDTKGSYVIPKQEQRLLLNWLAFIHDNTGK